MIRTCVVALLATAFAVSPATLAQGVVVVRGLATWDWEVSLDGQTWNRGLVEVPREQQSVEVRAQCRFDQETPNFYFGGSLFDGIVEGVGVGDTISNIQFGTTLFNAADVAVSRFGNTLKVDSASDSLPPGIGPRWLSPVQPHPITPRQNDFSNPFEMFSYRLNLDGTAGVRDIGAVFRTVVPPGVPSGLYVAVYEWGNTTNTYYQALTVNPASVRVIPTPSACLIPALAYACLTRRRRSFPL
jgi:hypothetical protein